MIEAKIVAKLVNDYPRFRSTVGLMATALLVLLATGLSVPLAAAEIPAEESDLSDLEIQRLKRTVDPWLTSNDDVGLHKDSANIRRLIDALIRRHADNDAVRYLTRFLKADPWAFDYQLTYGEILARNGQPDELSKRVEQAIRFAESDATLRRAYRLANRRLPESAPPLTEFKDTMFALVLVNLGNVSDFWLCDLRDALAERLGIRIAITRMPFDFGPPDRTALNLYIAQRRKQLTELVQNDPMFEQFLVANRSNVERLLGEEEEVLRIDRLIANAVSGKDGVAAVNRRFAEARMSYPQWEADRLVRRISLEIPLTRNPKQRFLAVTDHDIYSAGANFLFGIADKGSNGGLISCARFTALFTDETSNRERLKLRLVKQALSTYGFMLGIPRCSDPQCARAYPSSVAEHDQKSDQLCAECRAAFAKALSLAAGPPR